MVSPVKQLSSSQEGMECFLASLSRTSLSPRGRLIDVIESADTSEIANELAVNASNYSALELAVCLYAVRQHHEPQAVAPALASGTLMLASRLSSNQTCCQSTWKQLLSLLSKQPQINKLAGFLQDDDGADTDPLDDVFVYTVCTKLANILSLEDLDLHPTILDHCIAGWIDKRFPESPDCISSMLLAYYMCSYDRVDSWDLQSVCTSVAAVEFVLEAVSKSESPEKTESLMAAFTNLLEDDGWHFVRDLSLKALESLATSFKKCNSIHDPRLALAILDNSVDTLKHKLAFASVIIHALPHLDSSFLFALFSRVLQATHTQEQEAMQATKLLFELIADKPWNYDALDIHAEHADLLSVYKDPIDKCINGDVPTITHALYGNDPKNCTIICDKIKRKILSAVVAKLMLFAEENQACLNKLDPSRRDYRTQSGLKIKTASVGLAFFLYEAIETRTKKKKAFAFLKEKIRPIQTTLDATEIKVKKIYDQGIPALTYSDGVQVFHIQNPSKKKLSSQTPRPNGIPVD